MANTQRTDAHRPSAINPEDYTFIAFDYIGGSDLGAIMSVKLQRDILRNFMEKTGATYAKHFNSGSCHICGAGAVYLCKWHHVPSNQIVTTGEDCARKLDMSYGNMNLFRRNIADAREAQAGKRKAIAILSDLNLMETWEMYTAEYPKHADGCPWLLREQVEGCECNCGARELERAFEQFPERTIRDIVGKLVKYGNISENQITFVRKLIQQILDRPMVLAQRQAEKDAAGPVPTGRVEMTGEVVGSKVVEVQAYSRYSPTEVTKLIIRLENGSKVYGNCFAGLKKGDKVRFVASVEASKDDPKFGFFKRAALYQSPEQKKAIKALSHAYETQRSIQIKEVQDVCKQEGIDEACETLHRLWMQVLAEVGDPTGISETERYSHTEAA